MSAASEEVLGLLTQLLFVRSVPGDAHVHDIGSRQERHEGHRPADGARPSGQEGGEGLHHGPEDQNSARPTRVGKGGGPFIFRSDSSEPQLMSIHSLSKLLVYIGQNRLIRV